MLGGFDMVWLHRSPIPVGRRGVFYVLKATYLRGAPRGRGGGSQPPTIIFPSQSVDISSKDDLTVSILFSTNLGVVPTAATTVLTLLQGFLQQYPANLNSCLCKIWQGCYFIRYERVLYVVL